jgi:hypothetical protein
LRSLPSDEGTWRTGYRRAPCSTSEAAPRDTSVTPAPEHAAVTSTTKVVDVARVWLTELAGSDRSLNTRQVCTSTCDLHVIGTDAHASSLADLTVREVTVGGVERFLIGVAQSSGKGAVKMTRTVLRGDLTPAEQREVVQRLTARGRSIRDIATQLATTRRTVSRRRASLGAAQPRWAVAGGGEVGVWDRRADRAGGPTSRGQRGHAGQLGHHRPAGASSPRARGSPSRTSVVQTQVQSPCWLDPAPVSGRFTGSGLRGDRGRVGR